MRPESNPGKRSTLITMVVTSLETLPVALLSQISSYLSPLRCGQYPHSVSQKHLSSSVAHVGGSVMSANRFYSSAITILPSP